MFWHWVFSLTAGALAGFSLVGYRRAHDQSEERRHLLRGILSLAAILGFTYNGFAGGWELAAGTLLGCIAAAACAFFLFRRRLSRSGESSGGPGKSVE